MYEYIRVAVPLPVNGTFTYYVQEHLRGLVEVGTRVVVPFGQRSLTGYVMGRAEKGGDEGIKSIIDIIDDTPVFPIEMAAFFEWVSSYYLHPLGEVIETALPKGINISDKTFSRFVYSFSSMCTARTPSSRNRFLASFNREYIIESHFE